MQSALDEYFDRRTPPEVPDFDGAYSEAFGRKSRVLRGKEAQALADTPMLTGDPEFDRLELEETQAEPFDA